MRENVRINRFTCRRLASFTCLALSLLTLHSCSIAYDLLLEGELLAGQQQLPVKNATVTLMIDNYDCVSTTTDQQGLWNLRESLSPTLFSPGKNDKNWTDSKQLMLRIEVNGQTWIVPCPRVSEPESGGEFYAFVMTVLDAHPEPVSEVPQVDELPLEAVKPGQIAGDGENGSGSEK